MVPCSVSSFPKSVSQETVQRTKFYVILALLYRTLRSLSPRQFDGALVVLIVLFGAANQWKVECGQLMETALSSPLAEKLLFASFIPWVYMFLLGVIAQRHAVRMVPLLCRYRIIVLVGACGALLLCKYFTGLPVGNCLPALLVPLLGCCVLVCGYSIPTMRHRLLGTNDCSYGIYIYYMPLVNLALWCGGAGALGAVSLVLLGTATVALFSWRVIERPFFEPKAIVTAYLFEVLCTDCGPPRNSTRRSTTSPAASTTTGHRTDRLSNAASARMHTPRGGCVNTNFNLFRKLDAISWIRLRERRKGSRKWRGRLSTIEFVSLCRKQVWLATANCSCTTFHLWPSFGAL